MNDLKECIAGLKLYFDNATINETKLYRELGKTKYNRYRKAIEFMFNNFKDE